MASADFSGQGNPQRQTSYIPKRRLTAWADDWLPIPGLPAPAIDWKHPNRDRQRMLQHASARFLEARRRGAGIDD
jgi:hypothetical protein